MQYISSRQNGQPHSLIDNLSEHFASTDTNPKNIMDDAFVYKQLARIEKRFLLCCQQITLVDQKLDALQVRYIRANQINDRSARYSLRLQIATMEGMRNIYYQYAKVKGMQIAEIRRGLFDEDVEVNDYVEIPDWEEM